MEQVVADLLTQQEIEPVLVDIGASGGSPRIWQPIRALSTYVGFDPDTRDIRHPQQGEFRHARIVHEVITANGDDRVTFFLTRSPYCSSTLRPNAPVTDNFLSADSFIVERQESAPASNLNAVMDRLGLKQIDWMKIDTQGTDLRIYNSLRDDLRNKLLAIDIEPGLRGAYVGEDLFSDVHRQLTGDGFWLSNLKVCGLVRMRKSTLDALASRTGKPLTAEVISRCLRTTPGWTECRYLRSLEWLAESKAAKRDYLLLWCFALVDGQLGFCLDLSIEYAKLFDRDDVSSRMEAESLRRIEECRREVEAKEASRAAAQRAAERPGLVRRAKRRVERLLRGKG
jgi:hypothetical protein